MAYPPTGPPPYGGPGPQYGGGDPNGGYGYGYGPPQVEHPKGTTVLILGILGIVACGLCGPFAWSMGNAAKADVDAAPGRYSNASNVQVGRILGIVSSVILIIQVVFGVLWLIFVLGIIGTSSTSGY